MPHHVVHGPNLFLQWLTVCYLFLGREEYPSRSRCTIATAIGRYGDRPAMGVVQGRVAQDALHAQWQLVWVTRRRLSRVSQRSGRFCGRRRRGRGCGGDGGGRTWDIIGIFEGIGYSRRGCSQRERQTGRGTPKSSRKRGGLQGELGFGGELGARLAGSGRCRRGRRRRRVGRRRVRGRMQMRRLRGHGDDKHDDG